MNGITRDVLWEKGSDVQWCQTKLLELVLGAQEGFKGEKTSVGWVCVQYFQTWLWGLCFRFLFHHPQRTMMRDIRLYCFELRFLNLQKELSPGYCL